MSPQLVTHVKYIIYKTCELINYYEHTPLMEAVIKGLADMVWGFLECAKQTRTDLHTQSFGGPNDFLSLENKWGRTALDLAISMGHVEVINYLLCYVTPNTMPLFFVCCRQKSSIHRLRLQLHRGPSTVNNKVIDLLLLNFIKSQLSMLPT